MLTDNTHLLGMRAALKLSYFYEFISLSGDNWTLIDKRVRIM